MKVTIEHEGVTASVEKCDAVTIGDAFEDVILPSLRAIGFSDSVIEEYLDVEHVAIPKKL